MTTVGGKVVDHRRMKQQACNRHVLLDDASNISTGDIRSIFKITYRSQNYCKI